MNQTNLIEEKALKRSMVGALLLAVWGIVMAAVSGSSVILLDGMFNLISGIMSFFSIEITRLISGKGTREFPLGYFAFESLFVLAKGASILVLLLMALFKYRCAIVRRQRTGPGTVDDLRGVGRTRLCDPLSD
jgi:predicted Co/Zn/Cd cation transporter (cation efflux family)